MGPLLGHKPAEAGAEPAYTAGVQAGTTHEDALLEGHTNAVAQRAAAALDGYHRLSGLDHFHGLYSHCLASKDWDSLSFGDPSHHS